MNRLGRVVGLNIERQDTGVKVRQYSPKVEVRKGRSDRRVALSTVSHVGESQVTWSRGHGNP